MTENGVTDNEIRFRLTVALWGMDVDDVVATRLGKDLVPWVRHLIADELRAAASDYATQMGWAFVGVKQLEARADALAPRCCQCGRAISESDRKSGCPLCPRCQNGPIEEMS